MRELPRGIHPHTLFARTPAIHRIAMTIDELARVEYEQAKRGYCDLQVHKILSDAMHQWTLASDQDRLDAAGWVQGRWDRVK